MYNLPQDIQIHGHNLATLGQGALGKDSKVLARLSANSQRYVDIRVDSIMSLEVEGSGPAQDEQEEDGDGPGALAVAILRYQHGDSFKDLAMPLELSVQVRRGRVLRCWLSHTLP